jgi:hypothetical protein
MVVYVEGGSIVQQQITYQVVQHCYEQLISTHDVDIFVRLKNKLTDNLNGWCQHNYGNNFEIAIDCSLSRNPLIQTICHEMVHVKQSVNNEYDKTCLDKYSRSPHSHEFPWEIEAYQLEKPLFTTFMENYIEKG